ncbi:galactokinase [Microbacterium sp. zg.B48]|uniref:galactokinase n=1 Tax=Microbacterium sp. zg.B48 TaxID=2969408 RepID=UPI00214C21EE|nr:galactokinase [Microbacterium sp. zg.B48]MCR2763095.1 galactokinase [Microbacterium sp. zg.B48]
MSASAAARTLFTEAFGSRPAGIWSAPGRVNLIGEHTDYNDGFVLPFALPQRTHAAAGARGDGRIRVISTFDGAPVEVALDELDDLFPAHGTADRPTVPAWSAYPLGVAWALLHAAGPDAASGLDLAIASDVPIGAGLSSSAAIECAVAIALNDTWDLGLDRVALAAAARTAENDAVGAPTGIMDQMASLLGQPGAAVLLDCRSLEGTVVDLRLAEAGLALVVLDTGVTHAHATGGYRERRAACERGAQVLRVRALRDLTVADLPRAARQLDAETYRRVRHVVTENQRVLDTVRSLRTGGAGSIGELLLESHASMRDDFEISVPEVDTAVEAAMTAGAVGARMTGGGFGGAVIALVPSGRVDDVQDAAATAFAASGFAPPTTLRAEPSAGAGRDA